MAKHKYREIISRLQEDIASGRYKAGQRLPSETELVRRYKTSRMTVFRAMRELQVLGTIVRKVGSGTFVAQNRITDSHVFGLLIPELGQTEIFEAICQGMMEAPLALNHSLLWGNTAAAGDHRVEVSETLCAHYVERRVSGVFFAPVEFSSKSYEINHRIAQALDKAKIPIVLLDRCLEPYPKRSKYDLVGIDNRRASYLSTEHLLQAGARRLVFFARPNSAPTVDARIGGYREALQAYQHRPTLAPIVRIGDPQDEARLRTILRKDRPDAFLCANDQTAGMLMHTLFALGCNIPGDIRIVGFDDVRYATLLPVPLTTQHQPCKQIGRTALSVMLERIASPDIPPRDILLGCNLVVRRSCGSKPAN